MGTLEHGVSHLLAALKGALRQAAHADAGRIGVNDEAATTLANANERSGMTWDRALTLAKGCGHSRWCAHRPELLEGLVILA